MNKEYIETLGNYKFRVLNYTDWMKYVEEKYKETALKNLNRNYKKQREQIKNSPLNFCI